MHIGNNSGGIFSLGNRRHDGLFVWKSTGLMFRIDQVFIDLYVKYPLLPLNQFDLNSGS